MDIVTFSDYATETMAREGLIDRRKVHPYLKHLSFMYGFVSGAIAITVLFTLAMIV